MLDEIKTKGIPVKSKENDEIPTKSVIPEDIWREIKLKVGIIGVGNGGSQVAQVLYKEGYEVFVINTSIRDLRSEIIDANINSYLLGEESAGAGQDRELAKEIFYSKNEKNNGRLLFEENKTFRNFIEKCDIIFIIATTAGGTGGGIAPEVAKALIKIYQKTDKKIIFYGILPFLPGSIPDQKNTIDCTHEIDKLKMPYMLADLNHFASMPDHKAYEAISDHIKKSIAVIEGKYLNFTRSGMIDENDMRKIVQEPGYIATYHLDNITTKMVEEKKVHHRFLDKIKDSPAAPINKDFIVKQFGLIINSPEEILEVSGISEYGILTDYLGTPPGSIFKNYSVQNTVTGQFILIVSGMSLPYGRLSMCENAIKDVEEKLKKQKNIDLTSTVNDISFLEGLTVKKTKGKTVSDDDRKDALDNLFG